MILTRLCRIKDVKEKTNGLISGYAARLLYLRGEIEGLRIGRENSPILINLDSLEAWIESKAKANIKQEREQELQYGKLRKIQ